MTELPRSIRNRITGDRIEFITSPLSGDTGMLRFRCVLPPHAAGAPVHVHDEMVETFAVETGELRIDLGPGGVVALRPGDMIRIAPGTPHGFSNPGPVETCFVTTATPGAGLETFLRTMYALAAAGRTDRHGMPTDPRAVAFVLSAGNIVPVGVPRLMLTIVLRLGQLLSRLTGSETRLAGLAAAPGAAVS